MVEKMNVYNVIKKQCSIQEVESIEVAEDSVFIQESLEEQMKALQHRIDCLECDFINMANTMNRMMAQTLLPQENNL